MFHSWDGAQSTHRSRRAAMMPSVKPWWITVAPALSGTTRPFCGEFRTVNPWKPRSKTTKNLRKPGDTQRKPTKKKIGNLGTTYKLTWGTNGMLTFRNHIIVNMYIYIYIQLFTYIISRTNVRISKWNSRKITFPKTAANATKRKLITWFWPWKWDTLRNH